MKKIHIDGYELTFPANLVEEFQKTVPDTFENSARGYLLFTFEKSLEEIFAEHSVEELQEVVITAAKEEIKMCGGKAE